MSSDFRLSANGARVLMLPGLGNSGPVHWQTLWQERERNFARVEQDDWDRPVLGDWVSALERALAPAEGPVVLVAHSLACALVAHWAGRAADGAARRVCGALLVAPADVDAPERTPPETRGFAPMPLAPLPFPATVVASRDDAYVSFERARHFAACWGARFVDAGAVGHINSASGLGDWPEGRRHLGELVARVGLDSARAGS